MKFKEMSTDQALNVMCELVEPLTTIGSDKQLISAYYERTIVDKETTQKERSILGTIQVVKNCKTLIPKLLKDYRTEVYQVLSIINERPIEEIRNQPVITTMSQIKGLMEDSEFVDFSSQLFR